MTPLAKASHAPGLLLLCLTLVVYTQVLGGAFQYDDYNVIVGDPTVHSLGAWAAGLGGLRPLLKLSYAVNWRLDHGAVGFLAFNLVLHLLNTWMVHRLLLVVGEKGGLPASRVGISAFLGALVFAVHPLQTEAVAYVSGRSSALSATLALASVLAYLRGRESGRGLWTSGLSVGFFGLALLVKETALVIPLALVLLEAGGLAGPQRAWRGPWAHGLLMLLGFGALSLHPGYRKFLATSFSLRGVGEQARGALEGLSYLFGKLGWPVDLNLDPPLQIPAGWTLGLVLAGMGLMGLLLLGLAVLRTRAWLGWGLLWGLIFLLPTQGPVPRLDLANERHLYLSLAGFAFVIAGLLSHLPRVALGFAGCGLAVALGLASMSRIRDYRDEVTLWKASLRVAPENARAWNNLGVAHYGRGADAEAIAAFREALRLRPGYRVATDNLRSLESR